MTDTGNTAANSAGRKLAQLAVLAIIVALCISLVAEQTSERIAANQTALALATIAATLPKGMYNNKPNQDYLLFTDPLLGPVSELPVYFARSNGETVAVVISAVAPDGYVAPIKLLVGMDAAGNILAVKILSHRETPGLGDRIESSKSNWLQNFIAASTTESDQQLRLRRDGGSIDHLSGATITSRAVADAVANVSQFYKLHQAELFAANPSEP